MIKEIGRTFPNEIVVLERKDKPNLDEGVLDFLVKPGVEIDGEVKPLNGWLTLRYDFKTYQLTVAASLRERITAQEERLFLANAVEDIFVKSIKELQATHGLRLTVRGFNFRKFKEKETETISLFFAGENPRYQYEKFEIQDILDDRQRVYQEMTYFRKHEKTREDIQAFVRELAGTKTTKSSYLFSLERFYEWLIQHHYETYPAFDEAKINQFIIYLHKEQQLSSYYVNRCFTALLKYCKFIGKAIDRELAVKKDLPRLPNLAEVRPRSLSDVRITMAEQFLKRRYVNAEQKLAGASPTQLFRSGVRDHWRNLLVFRLCLDSCLRISEAIGLDIKDVDLKAKTPVLHVKGKGNKDRDVPIADHLVKDLKSYIKWREENDYLVEIEKQIRHWHNGRPFNFGGKKVQMQDILEVFESEKVDENEMEISRLKQLDEERKKEKAEPENEPMIEALAEEIYYIYLQAIQREVKGYFKAPNALFVSNRTTRVSIKNMQRVFSEIGRQKHEDGTWEKGVYAVQAHELRHTGIKLMVDNGVSINKIRLITGHETADMVLRYSKSSVEEAAEAINNMRKRK